MPPFAVRHRRIGAGAEASMDPQRFDRPTFTKASAVARLQRAGQHAALTASPYSFFHGETPEYDAAVAVREQQRADFIVSLRSVKDRVERGVLRAREAATLPPLVPPPPPAELVDSPYDDLNTDAFTNGGTHQVAARVRDRQRRLALLAKHPVLAGECPACLEPVRRALQGVLAVDHFTEEIALSPIPDAPQSTPQSVPGSMVVSPKPDGPVSPTRGSRKASSVVSPASAPPVEVDDGTAALVANNLEPCVAASDLERVLREAFDIDNEELLTAFASELTTLAHADEQQTPLGTYQLVPGACVPVYLVLELLGDFLVGPAAEATAAQCFQLIDAERAGIIRKPQLEAYRVLRGERWAGGATLPMVKALLELWQDPEMTPALLADDFPAVLQRPGLVAAFLEEVLRQVLVVRFGYRRDRLMGRDSHGRKIVLPGQEGKGRRGTKQLGDVLKGSRRSLKGSLRS